MNEAYMIWINTSCEFPKTDFKAQQIRVHLSWDILHITLILTIAEKQAYGQTLMRIYENQRKVLMEL